MSIRYLAHMSLSVVGRGLRPWIPLKYRKRLQAWTVPLFYKLAPKTDGAIRVGGHLMHLSSNGKLPPIGLTFGRYETDTTRIFEDLIKPGTNVIDVGAHVGYYTLLAARSVGPTGRVFAFEPDESNYSNLGTNIELNDYQNVIATKSAVSDFDGRASLALSSLYSGIHFLDYQESRNNSVRVDTTTLDTFLENHGSPEIGLVKIDVEGSEERVIDGMTRLLDRQDAINIILEFHPRLLGRSGVNSLAFLKKLFSLNFEINNIDGRNRLIPNREPGLTKFLNLVTTTGVNILCTRR